MGEPKGLRKERSVADEKTQREAIDQRTRSVWKAMLIWTGFNLVLWAVWWLYRQEFEQHRSPGIVALSFWLLFTGFVWAQVVGTLVDYWKLEKRKKLLEKRMGCERRSPGGTSDRD